MKNLLKIFALGLVVMGFSACDDFLEETPNGQILTNSAFTLPTDADEAVHVLYRKVSRGNFSTRCHTPAYAGDDLSTHPASNKALFREVDNYNIAPGNGNTEYEWTDKWEVIKAANYVINGVEACPTSQEKINYALGSGYFWRAWAYYMLVRAYGPLPIILTNEVNYGAELATVAQVYSDVIIPDLQKAEELLLPSYSAEPQHVNGVDRVANRVAAKALLAHVYLTMAGWPLEYGTEYYTLAANKAKEVIDNYAGSYPLYDNFADLHSVAVNKVNKNNKELILGVFYSWAYSDGDSRETCRGAIMDLPDCAGAWCDTRGEYEMYSKMPDGPRKDVTYPKTATGDGVAHNFWDDEVPAANQFPYNGKALETDGGQEYNPAQKMNTQFGGWGEKTHQVIRMSEVYLWYAEALGRSGQTSSEAIGYVNMIRNRADGNGAVTTANVYPTSMSASQLAEAAYDEHGYEVACEWHGPIAYRYYDMRRMKRVEAHFNLRKSYKTYQFGGKSFQEPNAPTDTWSDAKMFFPYPEQEVTRAPALAISNEDKLNLIK